MPDYEHKKIIETTTRLDAPPSDAQSFAEWIKANAHLAFLRDNADADEVVVYASGEYTFIHSLMVPNSRLSPPDQDDLLSWNCNAYTCLARQHSCSGRLLDTRRIRRWLGLRGNCTEELKVEVVRPRSINSLTCPL